MTLDDLIVTLAAQLRALAPEERQMQIDRLVRLAEPVKKRRASRRVNPAFAREAWVEELVDYCSGGGPAPSAAKPRAIKPGPTRVHEPPRPPTPTTPRARKPSGPAEGYRPPTPPHARRKRRPPDEPQVGASEQPRPNPPPEPRHQPRPRSAPFVIDWSLLGDLLAPAHFSVLGLPYPCPLDMLKTRWRELALRHHPDRGGDAAEFIRVKTAYEGALKYVSGG